MVAMKIDLHCHSIYSHDNFLDPQDLIKAAINKKLDGVCFTEHYSVEASLSVTRLSVPEGFIIFRGVEISTNLGHLLAYGLKNDDWNCWARDNYLDAYQVIDAVHFKGGICVPSHPYRGWESFGDKINEIEGLDAIEIQNGKDDAAKNRKARLAAQKRGLPGIGGSDCHRESEVGRAFTIFDEPVRSMSELIEAIRSNRCRPGLDSK